MGALATAWQARISSQQQIQLTNADTEGGTSVNTTRLAAAETDASNQFFTLTGVEFDSTDTLHITIGVLGVTYFLYSYRGLPKSGPVEAAKQEWEQACSRYAKTGGALVWGTPLTNSNLQPTEDESGELPRFDRRVLSELIPRMPNTGASDDRTPLDFGRGA